MNRKALTLVETAELLKDSDRFLILTHKHPDGDTAGSAAALVRLLRALGKTAYALPNPELTPRYLPLLFPLYAPEDYEADTVVSTDVASAQLLPSNAANYAARIALAIDHHGTNSLAAERVYIEADSASCGEIIYSLLKTLGLSLTTETADALYAALSADTGCFRYSNTTPRTHRIAATLMEAGCHAAGMNHELFELHTRSRVAIESAVLNNVRFEYRGAVALIHVSKALVASTGATEDDMEQLSVLPRNIEGVRVGITLYERDNDIKVSVRTAETADAAAICQQFGGGGHARAAGATIAGTAEAPARLKDAEKLVLDAVQLEVPGL